MTDLIDELLQNAKQNDILGKITKKGPYGVVKYELDIDKKLSKILKKREGHYTTLKVHQNFLWSPRVKHYLIGQLRTTILRYFKQFNISAPNVLVVGLGNNSMVCDSIGQMSCKQLCIIDQNTLQNSTKEGHIGFVLPSVKGLTGVDSLDFIDAIIRKTSPNVVIAIDSLTASNIQRLGLTFQLSDAGICPGGGVGNFRGVVAFDTVGVPVLSIGVPLLIDISNLCDCDTNSPYKHFTPEEIDFVVERCANIIGSAINVSVFPLDVLQLYK